MKEYYVYLCETDDIHGGWSKNADTDHENEKFPSLKEALSYVEENSLYLEEKNENGYKEYYEIWEFDSENQEQDIIYSGGHMMKNGKAVD